MDKKDKKLLELLQQNSRLSLTTLAKAVNLSIDSTHKRMKKLQAEGIIARYGIFVDPKALGYELVVNAQIKLHNTSEEEYARLISYLKAHPNVTEVISVLGDFDLTCVFIAKDTASYESISREVRSKFKTIITDWKSVINLKVHKFEEYDMERL